MIVDFHCHTTCSDGSLSPQALINMAHENGVQYLSITDHDSVDAYTSAHISSVPEGMTLIPGIEFSCIWSNREIHVLGLNLNLESQVLATAIQQQKQHRLERSHKISEKLEKMGIKNAFEQVQIIACNETIGRPHFAQLLVQLGYAQNAEYSFKHYLGENKGAYVKQHWPHMEEITHSILAAGGTPVIAHPDKYKMTRSKLCRMVSHFKSYGGLGLEVISGRQRPEVTSKLMQIALEYQLITSVGSDFHTQQQAWLKLGMNTLPDGLPTVLEQQLRTFG